MSVENKQEAETSFLHKIIAFYTPKKSETSFLHEIIAFYTPMITTFIMKKVFIEKDVEDCIQEVFIKIRRYYQKHYDELKTAEKLDDVKKFISYSLLSELIKNTVIDYLRKEKQTRTHQLLVRIRDILDWEELDNLLSDKNSPGANLIAWPKRYIFSSVEFQNNEK